jgi:hypothetical protein
MYQIIIIKVNIKVITNIEMTTQYIQDKTSHIHTHTGLPREFWGPMAKGNLAPSSNSPINDIQTR